MAELTTATMLYPWPLGMETNADPVQIGQASLQKAVNAQYVGTRTRPGGCKKRPGIARQADSSTVQIDSANTPEVLFLFDYWSNVVTTKTAKFIAVTDNFKVFVDDFGGSWATEITGTSVTLNSFSQGGITAEVMNEDLILGLKGSTDSIVVWENQDTSTLLVGLSSTTGFSGVTSGSFFKGIDRCYLTRQHQSRMFYAGDNQNPDTLYFSKANFFNQFLVTGTNPAGNVQIFPGDGDPEGITAIFPSLNSQELYVAKRRKLYKILTNDADPNLWAVIKVSDEIGCVNHNTAKTIDQQDIYFESDLGIHSLLQVISGTQIIDGALISFPISNDFRSTMDQSVKGAHSAVYDSQRNIYVLATRITGFSAFNNFYVYDVETRAWSTWETSADVQFNFIQARFNASTGSTELYFGDKNGWVNRLDDTLKNDLDSNSISLQLRSALILTQTNFLRETQFTDAYLLVRAKGDTDINLNYRIDDQPLVVTNGSIVAPGGNTLGTDLLGDPTFILGVPRGVRPIPYKLAGVGYAIEIEIQHDELGQDAEIYGLIIKFDDAEETRIQQGSS